MENMNLAALLLTSLLSGLQPAGGKAPEHNIRAAAPEPRQAQADQRQPVEPGPLVGESHSLPVVDEADAASR